MAYKYTSKKHNKVYFLHGRTQKLKNSNREVTLYFFAKEVKEGALDAVPAGCEVVETASGLPVVRKKR